MASIPIRYGPNPLRVDSIFPDLFLNPRGNDIYFHFITWCDPCTCGAKRVPWSKYNIRKVSRNTQIKLESQGIFLYYLSNSNDNFTLFKEIRRLVNDAQELVTYGRKLVRQSK